MLSLSAAVSGCAPPELTAPEEALARRCLELAYEQEASAECAQQVTKPMEQAFLEKHPDFYEQLLAKRVAFVEERIAEDQRRADELSRCLDDREAGAADPPACEQFMAHEIARETENRRLRRCVQARLEGEADARQFCDGLSEREIEDEMQMERVRRDSRP
jgi:hypothetical protein